MAQFYGDRMLLDEKTASKIIGQDLASICDIYSKCLQKIGQKMINGLSCPVNALFASHPFR